MDTFGKMTVDNFPGGVQNVYLFWQNKGVGG